jgi:hypothetical protein
MRFFVGVSRILCILAYPQFWVGNPIVTPPAAVDVAEWNCLMLMYFPRVGSDGSALQDNRYFSMDGDFLIEGDSMMEGS